jgi:hypothetical protein
LLAKITSALDHHLASQGQALRGAAS